MSKTLTVKSEIRLKTGEIIPAGEMGTVTFNTDTVRNNVFTFSSPSLKREVKLGHSALVRKFGLKAPSVATMERWSNDGVAKTVFGARTEPDGYGPHGEPSWMLVLGVI